MTFKGPFVSYRTTEGVLNTSVRTYLSRAFKFTLLMEHKGDEMRLKLETDDGVVLNTIERVEGMTIREMEAIISREVHKYYKD